jgi:NADPH-dependent 7-cyano-7-deazaguanine reductase QueF-like protein
MISISKSWLYDIGLPSVSISQVKLWLDMGNLVLFGSVGHSLQEIAKNRIISSSVNAMTVLAICLLSEGIITPFFYN